LKRQKQPHGNSNTLADFKVLMDELLGLVEEMKKEVLYASPE